MNILCKCGNAPISLRGGKYCSRKCVYKYQNHIGKISHNRKGKKHWNYKGGKAKYAALHLRLQNKRGKAKICEDCEAVDNVEWANLSGNYQDVYDYKALCRRCHHKLDHHNEKRARTLGGDRLSKIASKGWETRQHLVSREVMSW